MQPDEANRPRGVMPDKKDLSLYEVREYSIFSWDGKCYKVGKEHKTLQTKSEDLRMAFDDSNQELYWRRSDGTCSLFTPEKLTVSFPDQTVITSFVDDSKEINAIETTSILSKHEIDSLQDTNIFDHSPSLSTFKSMTTFQFDQISQSNSSLLTDDKSYVFLETSYVFEHKTYATVNYTNSGDQAIIYLPNNIRVEVGKQGLIQIHGCENERISLTEKHLVFEANVLHNFDGTSHTTINFSNIFDSPQIVCQTVDSFGNVFSVDERGNTNLLTVKKGTSCNDDSLLPSLKNSKKIERFFVINRDLSGFEIINENYGQSSFSSQCCSKDLKLPLTKNLTSETDVFSLYKEHFLYKTKSEDYIFEQKEKCLPTLIKRKDLIKPNEMPKTVWFVQQLSKCDKQINKTDPKPNVKELPKAIVLKKIMKINTDKINFTVLFSNSLKTYMEMNEHIFYKYANMFLEDDRKSDIYLEGEKHKEGALGSKSYHAMDNLPIFLT